MSGCYIPNYYEHYDIKYFNVQWPVESHLWDDFCEDIERVREEGDTVVLHGVEHLEAPATLSALYLMKKYAMLYSSQIPMVPLQNPIVHAIPNPRTDLHP